MDAQVAALKDSTSLVVEFLGFSLNAILHQRELYPKETFQEVQRHGVSLYITANEEVKRYLTGVLAQVAGWVINNQAHKLLLSILDPVSSDLFETWTFTIQVLPTGSKSIALGKELQEITKQIAAAVALLPELPSNCSFELFVYTDEECEEPQHWEECPPQGNEVDGQVIQMRAFTTQVHRIAAQVQCFLQE